MIKLNQLFKKIVNNPPNLGSPESSFKGKSMNEIIDEIHHTFYTEVDRLLESASVSHSLETQYEALLEKRERLVAIGFSSAKEVQDAQHEIDRLTQLRDKNDFNDKLKSAIHYFTQKYPLYKFITQESVEKICNRYGLIQGNISEYIGTVPEKNLKQIESFNISPEDECYLRMIGYNDPDNWRFGFSTMERDSYSNPIYIDKNKDWGEVTGTRSGHHFSSKIEERLTLLPLEICAPISDFDTKDMTVVGVRLIAKVPDPVVLKPVFYAGEKYYLIVSAWGKEASDPDVVNEINN